MDRMPLSGRTHVGTWRGMAGGASVCGLAAQRPDDCALMPERLAARRRGDGRPHVLTVAMPGGTAVRLAAEQELRRRGWPAAATPADADVLLTAGDPAASFAAVLDAAWQAMPAPRVRVQASRPGELAAALETA